MGTIKISVKQLRQLLREEVLIEADKKMTEESGEDSIDMQIDRYFSDFEAEAKSLKKEGFNWHSITRRLLEAEEDEEGEEEEEEEDEDEEDKPKASPEGTLEDINVESFVNSVVRLIDNYDSLLEVRNTILRRASNFLNKNYKSDVVDAFNDYLSNEHGMEIGKSSDELASEKFIAPISDRAGGGGGGG